MDREDAIKVLKDFWSVYEVGTEIREAFETVIPELKESEDERIRKGLIEHLKELKEQSVEGSRLKRPEHYDAWIAWLEKQGEYKPVISDEAIREGVSHFGITQYQISNWLKKYVDVEKQGKNKPVDVKIVIPKFRIGDTIKLRDTNATYTITDISDGMYRGKGWSLDIEAGDECGDYELVQNPIWSEDDERVLGFIFTDLELLVKRNMKSTTLFNHETKWLKSLKERCTWKSSDEQMAELERLVRLTAIPALESLYNDLKALRNK